MSQVFETHLAWWTVGRSYNQEISGVTLGVVLCYMLENHKSGTRINVVVPFSSGKLLVWHGYHHEDQ